MFFSSWFSKKTTMIKNDLVTDIHSHLIPGIDDGAKTLEESLELIKGLQSLGYKKLITTPHIMSDYYTNTPDSIHSGLDALKKELIKENIHIEMSAAAEYYLDDGFYRHLESGELMTINNEFLLVETSYFDAPLQLKEMIFMISSSGYKPILAHPERYKYIKKPEKEYSELKERGVYFQVNINSFGGYYGREEKSKAELLSQLGYIDFLGSDTHKIKQVNTLSKVREMPIYHTIFEKNRILNDTL